jgi:hypothetical protein
MNRSSFILLALLIALVSCKEEESCQQGMSTGYLSEDWIYTNDSMQLRLQLPREWYYLAMGITPMRRKNTSDRMEEYVFTEEEVASARKDSPVPITRLLWIAKNAEEDHIPLPKIEFHLTTSTSSKPTGEEEIIRFIKHYHKYAGLEVYDIREAHKMVNLLMLPQGDDFYYFFDNYFAYECRAVGIIVKGCHILKIKIQAKDYEQFTEVLEEFRNFWLEY